MARLRFIVLILTVATTASGCWFGYGYNLYNTRHNIFETTISTANVATLTPDWTYDGVDGL